MRKHLNNFLYSLLLLPLLSSCLTRKSEGEARICNSDTGLTVEHEKYGIYIDYFGDYWFHQFNQKSTLNWYKDFLRTIPLEGTTGKVLYCAHTTLEPYCTTTAFLYENSRPVEISKALLASLKKAKAVNKITEEVFVGYNTFTKMRYELRDENLKIDLKHLEYICTAGPHTLRISFWTTEANEDWLDSETEGILKSLKTPL